jgi:hypothetical protein
MIVFEPIFIIPFILTINYNQFSLINMFQTVGKDKSLQNSHHGCFSCILHLNSSQYPKPSANSLIFPLIQHLGTPFSSCSQNQQKSQTGSQTGSLQIYILILLQFNEVTRQRFKHIRVMPAPCPYLCIFRLTAILF